MALNRCFDLVMQGAIKGTAEAVAIAERINASSDPARKVLLRKLVLAGDPATLALLGPSFIPLRPSRAN